MPVQRANASRLTGQAAAASSCRTGRAVRLDFCCKGALWALYAPNFQPIARLDVIQSGAPQGCRVQKNVTFNFIAGHKAVSAQSIKPLHNRITKWRIRDRIGMETTWPRLSAAVTAGHLDQLDRLAALVALDGFAQHFRVGKRRPLTETPQATRMQEDIPLTVTRIDKPVAPSRIVPLYPAFELKHLRIFKDFVSQNHNITRLNNP
nr:hypothetical protein [uncultured Maricaulis sp.]